MMMMVGLVSVKQYVVLCRVLLLVTWLGRWLVLLFVVVLSLLQLDVVLSLGLQESDLDDPILNYLVANRGVVHRLMIHYGRVVHAVLRRRCYLCHMLTCLTW